MRVACLLTLSTNHHTRSPSPNDEQSNINKELTVGPEQEDEVMANVIEPNMDQSELVKATDAKSLGLALRTLPGKATAVVGDQMRSKESDAGGPSTLHGDNSIMEAVASSRLNAAKDKKVPKRRVHKTTLTKGNTKARTYLSLPEQPSSRNTANEHARTKR